MFAVKAKIYGVLYNQASSVAFDETSSYWSALESSIFLGFSLVTTWLFGFHWSAFRNHEGSTFTEKDQNKVNDRIGPLRSDSVIKLVSDLITELDQDVRAVHSCNSWLYILQQRCLRHKKIIFTQSLSYLTSSFGFSTLRQCFPSSDVSFNPVPVRISHQSSLTLTATGNQHS